MRSLTSRHNPIVGAFRALADTPDPAGVRLLLDGIHLVRDAYRAGLSFETVAVAGSRLTAASEEQQLVALLERNGADVIAASDGVLRAMSPVQHPSGMVAIARREPVRAADLCARPHVFVLVAVDVQDPGNLGSLLRAAEAGGVTGAIVCAQAANPFSWKALRGSMGSTLRLPVAAGIRATAALDLLQRSGVRTVAAVARDGRDPDAVQWTGSVALIVGGEGPGLSRELVARCDDTVSVPMAPPVESLNVAVAGAVLVYAARRHRQERSWKAGIPPE